MSMQRCLAVAATCAFLATAVLTGYYYHETMAAAGLREKIALADDGVIQSIIDEGQVPGSIRGTLVQMKRCPQKQKTLRGTALTQTAGWLAETHWSTVIAAVATVILGILAACLFVYRPVVQDDDSPDIKDGTRLKIMREALGMSQIELGERLGKSQPTICRMEREESLQDWVWSRMAEIRFEVAFKKKIALDMKPRGEPAGPG